MLRSVLPASRPRTLVLDDAPALPRRSMPAAGKPLMVAQGLLKQFGGLVANKNMGLSVNAAEVTALIGPNGAGKSTLFNLLSGVLTPNAGQITFNGQRIEGLSPRAIAHLGVSRTFQHVRLLGEMSVLENVALGAHMRGESGLLCASLHLERDEEARLLVLGGPPFGEPIVMWWNFIERSHEEIVEARQRWNDHDSGIPEFVDQIGSRTPAPELPNVTLRARL